MKLRDFEMKIVHIYLPHSFLAVEELCRVRVDQIQESVWRHSIIPKFIIK